MLLDEDGPPNCDGLGAGDADAPNCDGLGAGYADAPNCDGFAAGDADAPNCVGAGGAPYCVCDGKAPNCDGLGFSRCFSFSSASGPRSAIRTQYSNASRPSRWSRNSFLSLSAPRRRCSFAMMIPGFLWLSSARATTGPYSRAVTSKAGTVVASLMSAMLTKSWSSNFPAPFSPFRSFANFSESAVSAEICRLQSRSMSTVDETTGRESRSSADFLALAVVQYCAAVPNSSWSCTSNVPGTTDSKCRKKGHKYRASNYVLACVGRLDGGAGEGVGGGGGGPLVGRISVVLFAILTAVIWEVVGLLNPLARGNETLPRQADTAPPGHVQVEGVLEQGAVVHAEREGNRIVVHGLDFFTPDCYRQKTCEILSDVSADKMTPRLAFVKICRNFLRFLKSKPPAFCGFFI